MDDDSKHAIHNWGSYYRSPPLKGNLGLQLMSSDTKPFLPTEPSMDFIRDVWYHNNRDSSKMLHLFQNTHHQHSQSYDDLLPEASAHSFQMLPPAEEVIEPPLVPQLDVKKSRKSKKGKKAKKDDFVNHSGSGRGRLKKSMDMVINGIDLDISGIPTPVCSCTGQNQQCYRWGVGGWQSACCTSSISSHPLPMSTKRRGARIAGRKMSQGAFKKVLENLAGEGEDLSSPIDLKPFWAKHGTNKFVTIR